MSANIIVLIVFIVLFSLLLIAFVSIFVTKRVLLNNNYKLKLKFNQLIINPLTYNINSIESLVNNNNELEPLLNYLNQYNENFKQESLNLKKFIQESNKDLDTYKLCLIHQQQKQIKHNLDLLIAQQQKMHEFSLNTNSYSHFCSNISLEIFNLLEAFKEFFKLSKLELYYPNINDFISYKNNINDNNLLINEQLNYINSQEMNKLLIKQFITLKKFNNFVKQLFECEKYFYTFELNLTKLSKQIKDEKNQINVELLNEVNQLINNKSLIVKNYKTLVNQSKFDLAISFITKQLRLIDNLRTKMIKNDQINKLYDDFYSDFKIGLNEYYDLLNKNKISNIYRNIIKQFGKNEQVKKDIEDNLFLINNIFKELEHFEKIANVKSLETIDAMIKLSTDILNLKNKNNQLLKLLKEINDKYVSYIYKLNDLKIKIYYLMRISKKTIKDNKFNEDEKYNKLSSLFEQNDYYYNEIKKNPNYDKFNELDNFINETNSTIETISNFIRDNVYIVEIIKKLKLYTNRYLTEANQNQFDEIDLLIKNKKYDEALEKMINIINTNNNESNFKKNLKDKKHAVS